MKVIKDRKKRLFLALLLGMLFTLLTAGGEAGRRQEATAFYGMLYPRFCFSEVPETTKEGVPLTPKLTFRWLRPLSFDVRMIDG